MSSCLLVCSVGAARASPLQARGAGRRVVPSAPCLPRVPSAARCTLACARGSRQRAGVSRSTVFVAAADADDEPWEIDLQVTGMVCEGCVSNVEAALSKSKGVVGVKVDLASGIATVEVQAATAVRLPGWTALSRGANAPTLLQQIDAMGDAARLADVVKAAGFEAVPIL